MLKKILLFLLLLAVPVSAAELPRLEIRAEYEEGLTPEESDEFIISYEDEEGMQYALYVSTYAPEAVEMEPGTYEVVNVQYNGERDIQCRAQGQFTVSADEPGKLLLSVTAAEETEPGIGDDTRTDAGNGAGTDAGSDAGNDTGSDTGNSEGNGTRSDTGNDMENDAGNDTENSTGNDTGSGTEKGQETEWKYSGISRGIPILLFAIGIIIFAAKKYRET